MTFDLKDPVTGQIKSFASALDADKYLSSVNTWTPTSPVSSIPVISTPIAPSRPQTTPSQPIPLISTPSPTAPQLTSTQTQFGQVNLISGTPAIPTVPQDIIDWGKAPSGYFYNAFGQLMREEAQVFDAAGKQINYIATPTGVYSPQINPTETNIRQIQEVQAFKPARITVSSGAPVITAKTFESPEELQKVAPYITNIKDIEELSTDRLTEAQVRPTQSLPAWFESGRIPVSDLDASGKYIGRQPVALASGVGVIPTPASVRQTSLIQSETPIGSPRPPSGNLKFYSPSSTVKQTSVNQPVVIEASTPSIPSYYPDQRMTSIANGKVDIRLSKSDIERMNNGEDLYFSILPTGGFDITTSPVKGGTNLSMRHQDIDWSKSSVVVDLNQNSVAFDTNKGNFTLMSPTMTGMDYYNKVIPVQKGNVAKEAGFYRAFLEPTGIVSEMDKANMNLQLSEDEWNKQVRDFSKLKSDYSANRYAQLAAQYGQFQDLKDNRETYEALGFKIQTDNRNNVLSVTPPSQDEFEIRVAYAQAGIPIPPNVNASEWAGISVDELRRRQQENAASGIMGSMSNNASSFIRSRKQIYNKNAFREVLMPKSKPQQKKRKATCGAKRQGLIYPIPNLNPFKSELKQTRKKVAKKKTPRKARTATKTRVEERMSRNVNKFLGW